MPAFNYQSPSMNKTLFAVICSAAFLIPATASAKNYGSSKSYTKGNTTHYYQGGKPLGKTVTNGNKTTYYPKKGKG